MSAGDKVEIGDLNPEAQAVMRRYVNMLHAKDPRAEKLSVRVLRGWRPTAEEMDAFLDGPVPPTRPALQVIQGGKATGARS